jgi:hypothetical protein
MTNRTRDFRSNYAVRFALLLLLFWSAMPAWSDSPANEAEAPDEFHLTIRVDPNDQGGAASADVRIHASREVLWGVLTSCEAALTIVPGLKVCEVLEDAPDHSWQRIRQVMDYSWIIPRVNYVMQANYKKPDDISFEKIAGDPMRMHGSWTLQSEGEFTVAHYQLDFMPGFWVPHWFVRSSLKRDLPKMLRALRIQAEAAQRNRAP